MAETDLAVLGHGAGDAEGLEAFADGRCGLRGGLGVLLDGNRTTEGIGPLGVLERDGLNVGRDVIWVEAEVGADLQGVLEIGDAILLAGLGDLVDATLIAFERNCHSVQLLSLLNAGIDDLGGTVPLTVTAHGAVDGLLGIGALLEGIGELAEVEELKADDLVLVVKGEMGDVALGELEVTGALGGGAVHGAHHGAQALAEVIQAGADGQAVLGEGRLGAAVDDLEEELPHGDVDGITDEVGVEGLEDGLLGEDLGGHGGGVRHARAADGLDEALLDNALLDVEAELAGALLRRTPADTMGVAGDVRDLFRLNPLALFGNGCRSVVCALGDGAHLLHFCGILHLLLLSRTPRQHPVCRRVGRRRRDRSIPPGEQTTRSVRHRGVCSVEQPIFVRPWWRMARSAPCRDACGFSVRAVREPYNRHHD